MFQLVGEINILWWAMSDTRPSVLVLGATGVVGRSFVEFLVNNSLAYAIRAVDKRVPPRAFLKWVGLCVVVRSLVPCFGDDFAAVRTWPPFRATL